MTGETKICTRCGEEKELSEFWKCNQYESGYHQYCKQCMQIYKKARRDKLNSFVFDYDSLTITGKTCTKCGEYKPLSEYVKDKAKSDGYKNACVECTNKYRQKYRDSTPEQVEKARERSNEWYQDDDNKARQKITSKEWVKNNKKRINDWTYNYIRDKKKNDELFRLKCAIRSNISVAFRDKKFSKNMHTEEIIGCTFEEFKIYIESKFEPWMNWDNYGKYNGQLNYGWDLDHIVPLSSAKTVEDVIKLNHYTNLQPLCSYTNRYIKRDKILK